MKIWISGADGLVGRATIKACIRKKIPYIGTNRLTANITDLEQLKRFCDQEKCTHLINCASYTDVDRAEKESLQAYHVNAKGPKHLGILTTLFPLTILHLSTDYVFDGIKTIPYTEEDTPCPLSVYGKSKWEGEQELLEKCPKATIVRTSWIIGEGGKSFIAKLPYLLLEKEHISIYGRQISALTYVEDLVDTLFSLLSLPGYWHVVNQGSVTREEIYHTYVALMKMSGFSIKTTSFSFLAPLHEMAPRPLYSVLSTEKLKQKGIVMRPWQTTLGEYINALPLSV